MRLDGIGSRISAADGACRIRVRAHLCGRSQHTHRQSDPEPGAAAVPIVRADRPSVLIDDLELHPVEDELPKLPVVSPPDMTR